jgi:hypothetical protein
MGNLKFIQNMNSNICGFVKVIIQKLLSILNSTTEKIKHI